MSWNNDMTEYTPAGTFQYTQEEWDGFQEFQNQSLNGGNQNLDNGFTQDNNAVYQDFNKGFTQDNNAVSQDYFNDAFDINGYGADPTASVQDHTDINGAYFQSMNFFPKQDSFAAALAPDQIPFAAGSAPDQNSFTAGPASDQIPSLDDFFSDPILFAPGPSAVQVPVAAGSSPEQDPVVAAPTPVQSSPLAGPSAVQVPAVAGSSPEQDPVVATPAPVQPPIAAGPTPVQAPVAASSAPTQPPVIAGAGTVQLPSLDHQLTKDGDPLVPEPDVPGSPILQSPPLPGVINPQNLSPYGEYPCMIKTREEARKHRRRSRIDLKKYKDPNLNGVKEQRDQWVCKIYNAMINLESVQDNSSSTHFKRFKEAKFDQLDLEATAHAVFDKCLSIHEKGWTKPSVYKVEAKRGDKKDVFKNRVEGRLFEVVETLRVSKAACNDALQGGITLLRLCYNPKQLRCSKDANKVGNFVKKVRLEVGKQTLDSSEDADGEDAGGEEDGGEEDGSEE